MKCPGLRDAFHRHAIAQTLQDLNNLIRDKPEGSCQPIRTSVWWLYREIQSTPYGGPMSQLIAMFCDIDDFCKWFEPLYTQRLLQNGQRQRPARGT